MTGILTISIFLVIVICSITPVRKRNFELFQAAHLLVYPLIGLLMAHGTRGWLQRPMFGDRLAAPALLLLGERMMRLQHYSIDFKVDRYRICSMLYCSLCTHGKNGFGRPVNMPYPGFNGTHSLSAHSLTQNSAFTSAQQAILAPKPSFRSRSAESLSMDWRSS